MHRKTHAALAKRSVMTTGVVKIDPDDVFALYNCAVTQRNLHRSDEALADIDRALALKPDFAEALISRGRTLRLHGSAEEAIECFREA
jgi:adenylate cyclase